MTRNIYRPSLYLALAALLLMLAANAFLQHPSPETPPAVRLVAEGDGYALYAGEPAPAGETRSFDRETLYQGLLLYVGTGAPLPEDLPVQQSRDVRSLVGLYVPAAERVSLSEDTIYALCRLAADNPLVNTWIMAGMRSPREQAALQQETFAAYQRTMPVAEALERAALDIPDSGQSEHQLATAFDLRFHGRQSWAAEDPMARTEDGRWLLENGWRYGFLRRYPPDKNDVTGVMDETLHWRYVGPVHAAALHVTGLCLEEYLALLHREGTLRLADGQGNSWWLLCVPMTETAAAFPVPPGYAAAVSADNLGYAVCVLSPGA